MLCRTLCGAARVSRGAARNLRLVQRPDGGSTPVLDAVKEVRLVGLVRPVGGLVRRMNFSLPAMAVSGSRKRVRPQLLPSPFGRSPSSSVSPLAAVPQRAIPSSRASVPSPVAAIEGCALGLWMMWLFGAAPEAPWARAQGPHAANHPALRTCSFRRKPQHHHSRTAYRSCQDGLLAQHWVK